MIKTFKKLIIFGLISCSTLLLPIGVSAEWRQDTKGWWYADGSSWATGWRNINNKWYFFGQDGYMAHDVIIDGKYKLDNNGEWIQNITSNNNSNNVTNNTATTDITNTATSNSNNMTNLTSNTDNSINNSGNTTLNNTGVINYNDNSNTTNNVTVDNTSKEEKDYYKELKKEQKQSNESLKLYYQKQLNDAKSDLKQAQTDLERVKTQGTIQTYVKDPVTNQWNYKYVADTSKINSAQKRVETYQNLVDYYEKQVKQYS